MKKLMSLILAVLMVCSVSLLAASCGKNEEKILNVYTSAGFAPYEYIDDNGKVTGVDMDVMKAVGEKLGYKVYINDINFNAILGEVGKDVNAVGAAGMTKKPERDAVALASVVYATSVQYVIAPAGSFADGAVVTIEQVVALGNKDKGIGAQIGTTGLDMVSGAVEGSEVQAVEYKNAIIASKDIGTALAAVVIDKMPAESICKDKANLGCWALDADTESYVLYFNKNATELVEQVNAILTEMIADGTIDRLTVQHSGGN